VLGRISGVKSERTFSLQLSETRYIREIIYGKKRAITYWEITTDPETMPDNSTSYVMTNLQGNLKKTCLRPIWIKNLGRIWFPLLVNRN
jgi:SRSO17 transposase